MAHSLLTAIDTGENGDTFYEGMVTAEANFLTVDEQLQAINTLNATQTEDIATNTSAIGALSEGSGVVVESGDTAGFAADKLLGTTGQIDVAASGDADDRIMTWSISQTYAKKWSWI